MENINIRCSHLINKIFCIGYPRTGTSSLSKAMSILGFRSWHYNKIFYGDVVQILKTKNIDYEFFDIYHFFADTPIFYVYKKLDKKYPKSKFILTTRDADDWLKSMQWMIATQEVRHKGLFYEHNELMWNKMYPDQINEHKEKVLDYFKERPNDLLVIDTKDLNFKTITKFLKIPLMRCAFPHLNKSEGY